MVTAHNLDLDPKTDAEYEAAIDIMFVRLEKLHAEIVGIDRGAPDGSTPHETQGNNIMETIAFDKTPMTDADYEAIVDHNLNRLKQMQKQMDEDQREIESMRAETDARLANLMQTLKAA